MKAKKLLKVAALLFVVLIFLFSCGKKEKITEMTVLIRMMDIQDQWFRKELIPKAEKELGVKFNVVTFNKFEDIEAMIKLEKDSGKKTIGLVKTPQTEVYPLVKLGYMMPLKDIIGEEQLNKDKQDYVEMAMEFGKIDGVYYYIPRKLETNTFLYLKSKVADAVKNWEKMKDDINQMFKEQNGYGLPAGYTLEADPNQWDWFDLAVVAYYWAHTKGDDGLTIPRMAHRGKDYGGTTMELLTKLYQVNGTDEDFYTMTTDPVLDVFEWEAFYVKNGLYNPGMWEQSWSGGGIWKAFAAGQVYAAFMHQIDAFFIHGGSNPTMKGYLQNPDDMGLAIMPQGVSLELDKNGKPIRVGKHASNFAGWWWGIPVTSPNPEISYKLARFITSYEMHREECSIFGMMPVRKDVYSNLSEAFKEKWMQEVFKTALAQFKAGVVKPPMSTNFNAMGSIWRKAWYDIVTKKHYSPDGKKIDRQYILNRLKPYAEQLKELR